MKKLCFVNTLIMCVLGSVIFWPTKPIRIVKPEIYTAYSSVCMITSGTKEEGFTASGVLLESGYILTAAHVVDKDFDGEIDDKEVPLKIKFPLLPGKEFDAHVIATSYDPTKLDIAILRPDKIIPLNGVKLISDNDYWLIQIGDPLYTIGMQNGGFPSNITDGRMIFMDPHSNSHRNSANSYYGNSGGGVFIKNKLIGISSAMGIGVQRLIMPIFAPNGILIGRVSVPYNVPLANFSMHTSAPAIRKFILSQKMKQVLIEKPYNCPYKIYYDVILINIVLLLWSIILYLLLLRSKN